MSSLIEPRLFLDSRKLCILQQQLREMASIEILLRLMNIFLSSRSSLFAIKPELCRQRYQFCRSGGNANLSSPDVPFGGSILPFC